MNLDASAAAEDYIYTQLNSECSEIRLLNITLQIDHLVGGSAPLHGSLETHSLPLSKLSVGQRFIKLAQLPVFVALSYVWGDPKRTHEIIIDNNKIIRITTNLNQALRDLLKDASWNTSIWADAICINQDDLAERSSQVLLMREIYHSATDVHIWLGPSSNEGRKAMKFIADLTGEYGPDLIQKPTKEIPKYAEVGANVVLLPLGKVLKKGYAFGQTIVEIQELFYAAAKDDKARISKTRLGDLSLHQGAIKNLVKWKPSSRHWAKCRNEDFKEMARLIDTYLIENCHWFTRMWVVQEAGTAESANILYAGASLDLVEFLRGCCYLHYGLKAPLRNMRKLIGLESIRQGWIERERHPLRDLVRECRYRKATDPRDKIFALIGLMGDKINPLLQPDYMKPVGQVYANTTLHFITQSCSLDPICGWQLFGRSPELPSWVPDYNLDQEHAAVPLVPIIEVENIFSASKGHVEMKFPTIDEATSSKYNWRELCTTGFCLDSVAVLSKTVPLSSSFGDTEEIWSKTITGAIDFCLATDDKMKYSLDVISEVVCSLNEFWNSIRDSSKAEELAGHGPQDSELNLMTSPSLEMDDTGMASIEKNDPPNEQRTISLSGVKSYVVDAYIHSLFSGKFSAEQRLTREKINHILNYNIPTPLKGIKTQEVQEVMEICDSLIAGMRGRRISITKSGHIGSLPEETEIGDLVCILLGCSVPVVLRKQEGVEHGYEFVGECYLHGFMDGEAMAMLENGQLKAEDINLH